MWQGMKNIYHLFVALLANTWYGFPSRKLAMIGVTGTDGKTTTVGLIYHILRTAGMHVSMISSVGAIINGKTYDVGFHVTTPSSWKLQHFIRKASEGATDRKFLVLEVTSHALDQYRTWGIDFTIGVLTNITHEHLDYHKTWEKYVKTKAKLLTKAKIALINKDDQSYKILAHVPTTTYGKKDADITLADVPSTTNLIGEFNTYNILAAIACCKALGVRNNDIRKGIKTFIAPIGRQEVVHENEFMVMIDFAHTPNSFEKMLPEIKSMTEGRLIHVFGCAGKRDSTKRSAMGKISGTFADIIVLTAEDPRGEDINSINKQIMQGIEKAEGKPETFSIADRKEAIAFAIDLARKGDTILLTGKSHEKSMNYGRGEEPWSEYEAVEKALKD